jgi:hypothetical protein
VGSWNGTDTECKDCDAICGADEYYDGGCQPGVLIFDRATQLAAYVGKMTPTLPCNACSNVTCSDGLVRVGECDGTNSNGYSCVPQAIIAEQVSQADLYVFACYGIAVCIVFAYMGIAILRHKHGAPDPHVVEIIRHYQDHNKFRTTEAEDNHNEEWAANYQEEYHQPQLGPVQVVQETKFNGFGFNSDEYDPSEFAGENNPNNFAGENDPNDMSLNDSSVFDQMVSHSARNKTPRPSFVTAMTDMEADGIDDYSSDDENMVAVAEDNEMRANSYDPNEFAGENDPNTMAINDSMVMRLTSHAPRPSFVNAMADMEDAGIDTSSDNEDLIEIAEENRADGMSHVDAAATSDNDEA